MPLIVQIANGVAGPTERFVLTNSAQNLPSTILTYEGKTAKRVNITTEDNACRVALGGTIPTQGASGVGHKILTGDSIRLENPDSISDALLINAINGAVSIVQLTGEYS